MQGASGGSVTLDDMLVAMPCINFDAVFVAGGAASVAALRASGDVMLFVREACKHAKAISALGEGVDLLATAGVAGQTGSRPAGVSAGEAGAGAALAAAFMTDIAAHRHWLRSGKDAIAA